MVRQAKYEDRFNAALGGRQTRHAKDRIDMNLEVGKIIQQSFAFHPPCLSLRATTNRGLDQPGDQNRSRISIRNANFLLPDGK